MRIAIPLLALMLAACGGGDAGDAPSQRVNYERIAAVRDGLYKIKAAPGGALALFSDVRLLGTGAVCGTVDGQDGGGRRRFSVAGEAITIEQPRDPATVKTIEQTCTGPARRVVSRNAGYTDLSVEDALR